MVTTINTNNVSNFNNTVLTSDTQLSQQGRMYFDAGNYTAAWYCYNEAIKIAPNEQYYYYMRGACNCGKGDFQGALSDYNIALSLAKNNIQKGPIHLDMAIVYAFLGDDKNSINQIVLAAKCAHPIAIEQCVKHGIPY